MHKDNFKIINILIAIIVFMCFIVLISPILYDLICKQTGLNGSTAVMKNDSVKFALENNLQNKAKMQNLSPEEITAYFINMPQEEIANLTIPGRINNLLEHNKDAIKVEFDTNMDTKLGWEFKSLAQYIYVLPGSAFLVYFYVKNITKIDKIGTAIYNVTPVQTGQYFTKIQCFCFENIFLKAGQELKMPVLFMIEPEIKKNSQTNAIKLITLSYSFFLQENN